MEEEEEESGYVPSDLTPEECQELENIRRRKQELLADIQRLKDEIAEVTNEIENLGSTEERKTMQRNKQVAMGRKKFNMDPKKGIQFLIENDLLKNTCDDIAQFLYKGEGLNKTAIGDYLGERDEFNIQVLHSFVELHEFTDLNLVQALRQFLWSFRLPGEAQKIDRMMEAFAQRYCQCNPGVFQSTDTCYVLSFAIIMLNTSLHNPNVKDKPTVERFIAMNRGINDGGDLPEELLRNLYDSIKNEPFKIPEDDGNDLTHTFFNPDREGWLLKLGGTYPHIPLLALLGTRGVLQCLSYFSVLSLFLIAGDISLIAAAAASIANWLLSPWGTGGEVGWWVRGGRAPVFCVAPHKQAEAQDLPSAAVGSGCCPLARILQPTLAFWGIFLWVCLGTQP
ncbi:cytohesin-1 isoform X3 [Varanus komodoensis]|uniref:cytohesin-1 isoform X3 n=1 Tax=Varanus komodoensis TaxID=61221 RepID=UPI001CF7A683|nr:cytohesin-1 isoform X3 [Varanus komodoensis]